MKSHNENRNIFQHFVLTCFNVLELRDDDLKWMKNQGQTSQPDHAWIKNRLKLFDQFCYPSIRGQINQNFKWLVLFNINTPDVFKEKIEKYAEWENFIPIYISPCKKANDPDKITRYDIIPKYLIEEIEYLITTRIDSDDCMCKDYIELIQQRFDKQKFQFLNFTNGYVWKYNSNEILLDKQPSNPFISLIEKIDNIKTVWCGSHPDLNNVGSIIEIEAEPVWMQLSHGKSTNKPKGVLQPPSILLQIKKDFEIRKNLLSSFLICSTFYLVKLILKRTSKIRGYLGLNKNQLRRFRRKLH